MQRKKKRKKNEIGDLHQLGITKKRVLLEFWVGWSVGSGQEYRPFRKLQYKTQINRSKVDYKINSI